MLPTRRDLVIRPHWKIRPIIGRIMMYEGGYYKSSLWSDEGVFPQHKSSTSVTILSEEGRT